MSEQPTKTNTIETNPRTMRAVAAILGQTSTDDWLGKLNQTDGRNQSEQASFLATQSLDLRDTYERGGTIVSGVLTVPKENLSLAPEIKITAMHQAVEKLTLITGNAEMGKELAPQLVEMGNRIAGSNADGQTRLKIFSWLYRTLEGKQELLENEPAKTNEPEQNSLTQFNEKWQQIVELSETLSALEPKDKLPDHSFDQIFENNKEENPINLDETRPEIDLNENENAEEINLNGGFVAFERVDIGSDLPKIPASLSQVDFNNLLEKVEGLDSQLEKGVSLREILAPFQGYVEMSRLDNELRMIEEEYAKVHFQKAEQESDLNYRSVATREELHELKHDKIRLNELRVQENKLNKTVAKKETSEKVERSESNSVLLNYNNQTVLPARQPADLTEEELELRNFLTKEKYLKQEIETLFESIGERERNFRPLEELSSEEIAVPVKEELTGKVLALELPSSSVLKEKYPELTPAERIEKLTRANTFEIQTPAEYLFVREKAATHFRVLKEREIKNEYLKFESKNISGISDKKLARKELVDHQEKISQLKSLQPVFTYKLSGSQKILKAAPSERAVDGFNFVNEYLNYQLKQPETKMRRESVLYRAFVARLGSSKNSQDVLREAYKIRQENHLAVGAWKNSTKEERVRLARPLSKKEMSLLFLEQPARQYTSEMSYLKYNFAHYSQAKEKMTTALLEGKLEPSAEAQKLIESLEARVVRRNLETQHKATKHFCLSLQTNNQNLLIKNDFDHRELYQNLPPHEKDWIYLRAEKQKENLEYKIAFARTISQNEAIQPQRQTTNKATESLRQDFAAGTLWHQAAISTHQKSAADLPDIANTDQKILKTVGFLIHNQTEEANLRVGEWLEKQNGAEMKKAGEILKTFARATREIEDDRMTVTVKIIGSEQVSADDYKNLFAAYFPADYEKRTKFREGTGEKFRFEQIRRQAQTALLDEWHKDAQTKIYRPDSPVKVFSNEIQIAEEIEKIKVSQIDCRRAKEIQTAILLKTEEMLKKDLAKSNAAISPLDLKLTIQHAFSPGNSEKLPEKQKTILEKVQTRISISDFTRFTESSVNLEKGLVSINQSFANIAALKEENAQFEYIPQITAKNESLQRLYEILQKQAEAELTSTAAREKFPRQNMEVDETTAIDLFLNNEEREKAHLDSHRQTRISLEPTEIDQPNLTTNVQTAALEFADALESAYQAHLHNKNEFEITRNFQTAEEKLKNLNTFVEKEKSLTNSTDQKPVTLQIYERELARNEHELAWAKISEMLETGKISFTDLETKKINDFFSVEMREEIRLEAGERTRENLEPKELWANRQNFSEKLQITALVASDTLEKAHGIYHDKNAEPDEISRVFFALDTEVLKLKNERKVEQHARKFINFKTEFKRDLATMFTNPQPLENPKLLTAMTKGLLLNALENQHIETEKLGMSGDGLSEISRTITLAMVEDKKREKQMTATKSALVPVGDNFSSPTKTEIKTPNYPVKQKQFEHTR